MKQTKVKTSGLIPSKKSAVAGTTFSTFLRRQWYLKSFDAGQIVRGADINAMGAWKITKGDRRIVIAIIDGGFDLTHPNLNLPDKIVFPANYISSKSSTSSKNSYGANHGTMCAGIAVAENKSRGMVGVAPGCSFMPVTVSPEANEKLMIKVFQQAALHADVISCSWSPPPIYAPLSRQLYDTIEEIASKGGPRKKGVVICFSASNYNAPLNDPDNRQFFWLDKSTGSIKITHGPILNGYATHPNVIAVSASTSLNKKAAYSNWGKEISVCAPSNNFHPFVEKGRVEGYTRIWTTDNRTEDHVKNNGYTGRFGGTSCSTALVAGVAGLVLSANPELTAAEVKQLLQNTADKIGERGADEKPEQQKGIYLNGHSEWFGYGKINAGKVVRLAKRM